ncbi:hypothetical protein FACS1894145_5340 [Bacteroidia bacterium]|nr:hypothetical protein FACS189446_0380 [Bacteroidia bacterium]GHU79981.1 hypothetical protein FACS1894145_5340 [Bacteroidia bacterium]
MGIALSGRTGFIGFFIGLLLYLIFSWKNSSLILKNIGKILGVFILLLGVFYGVLNSKQRQGFIDDLFPFAFEAYYNYRDNGTLNTGSSDALISWHYYPIQSETLIFGEGADSDHSREYRHTDAGYMNNLIFGGVFYVLCLIIYQGLYFVVPMSLARGNPSRQKQIDLCCFLFLYAYMFILEYKSVTMGTQHITEVLLLYAGITYIIEQDALEEKKTVRVKKKPSRRKRRI